MSGSVLLIEHSLRNLEFIPHSPVLCCNLFVSNMEHKHKVTTVLTLEVAFGQFLKKVHEDEEILVETRAFMLHPRIRQSRTVSCIWLV